MKRKLIKAIIRYFWQHYFSVCNDVIREEGLYRLCRKPRNKAVA